VGLCFFEFAATEPLLPDAPPRLRRGGGRGKGIPRPGAGRGAPLPQNRRCPLASSSRGSIELANWHEGGGGRQRFWGWGNKTAPCFHGKFERGRFSGCSAPPPGAPGARACTPVTPSLTPSLPHSTKVTYFIWHPNMVALGAISSKLSLTCRESPVHEQQQTHILV
jgi:hypothetical protein